MFCSSGSKSKSNQQFINNFPQYPVKGPGGTIGCWYFWRLISFEKYSFSLRHRHDFFSFFFKENYYCSDLSAIDIISNKPTRQLFEAFKEVKSEHALHVTVLREKRGSGCTHRLIIFVSGPLLFNSCSLPQTFLGTILVLGGHNVHEICWLSDSRFPSALESSAYLNLTSLLV